MLDVRPVGRLHQQRRLQIQSDRNPRMRQRDHLFQIIRPHERSGVDDHRAEFLDREEGNDEFRTVGQRQQHTVAAAQAQSRKPTRHSVHARK